MNDVVQKFTDAMRDAGIVPTCPITPDGDLHRAHVENDRAGTLNLAYVLHLDGKPAGWWQYFKTGVSGTWSASGKRVPMTAEMRRQIEQAKAERIKEQAATQAAAAIKAREIWAQATIFATLKTEERQHRYLLVKCVKPHGARLYKSALVIPLVDETGMIVNLQFINADGTKRFLSGGRKKGCFSTIGDHGETILVCEGWATGASLHESTGHCVIVALDAGNLKPVAKVIRSQYPNSKIIVCADNDTVGIEKATIAAFACNGLFIAPPMAGQDFNDFVNGGGVVYG